jgi:hypothetical protein
MKTILLLVITRCSSLRARRFELSYRLSTPSASRCFFLGLLFDPENERYFVPDCTLYWSLDSLVGIAISYRLDVRGVGVRIQEGSRIFSSPRRPDWL